MTDEEYFLKNACPVCSGVGFDKEWNVCLLCNGIGLIPPEGHPYVVTDLRHANDGVVEMVGS